VVLVEAALIFPMVMMLIMASFEFALAFRSSLTLTNAVQAAARTASAQGNNPEADFEILQTLEKNLSIIDSAEVQYIVIFRAPIIGSSLDDSALRGCRTTSIANVCNRYTAFDLSRPRVAFGCMNAFDRSWCPGSRRVRLDDPPDLIGVHVELEHETATRLIGRNYRMSQRSIIQIEPRRS